MMGKNIDKLRVSINRDVSKAFVSGWHSHHSRSREVLGYIYMDMIVEPY